MSKWLASAALCLVAGSSAMAGGTFSLNPFSGLNFNPFTTSGANTTTNPNNTIPVTNNAPAAGASQATFPSPGQSLAGPSRLIDLMPSLHSLTNTHVIGYSVYPTQTDQYLAQFGFQRIR